MEIDAAMEARFKMYDKKIAQWLAICAGWQPESVETSSDLPDKVIKAVQLLILYIAPPDSAEHTATGGAVEPSSCKPLRPVLTKMIFPWRRFYQICHTSSLWVAPQSYGGSRHKGGLEADGPIAGSLSMKQNNAAPPQPQVVPDVANEEEARQLTDILCDQFAGKACDLLKAALTWSLTEMKQ